MPTYPEFPSDEDRERAPDPQRIIDRIIGGRLVPLPRHRTDSQST